MALLGLTAMTAAGVFYVDQASAVEGAESTTGEVLSTDVRVEDIDTGGSTDGPEHFPVVRYRYTYGGETYTSENVFPGRGSVAVEPDRAERIAERYAGAENVTVYVQPDDPAQSFLIEERNAEIPAIFGFVGFFFAALGGLGLWRRRADVSGWS